MKLIFPRNNNETANNNLSPKINSMSSGFGVKTSLARFNESRISTADDTFSRLSLSTASVTVFCVRLLSPVQNSGLLRKTIIYSAGEKKTHDINQTTSTTNVTK